MPLTRLDNLLSSKTGKYIYVSPDDFNASDALDNRGNSQLRPFVSIQRAFLEVARFSYVPGVNNDRFDQFTIMLSPGPHYIDNRPGDGDTAEIPVFNYDGTTDSWNDPAIFDLGNPNNILYRFNGRDGGATIPRGTSLVGADLRRTQLRPLYVPDPADTDVPRTSLFNVTGGCYFWQFTILDANPDNGPLNGQSYSQPGSTQKSSPLYSHHKMTNFVYADKEDLSLLYRKISKCFSKYQQAIDDVYTDEAGRIQDTWSPSISYTTNTNVVFGGEAYKSLVNSTNKRPDLEDTFWERLNTISREFDFRIQENRIVGPLADTVQLDEIVVTEPSVGLLDVTVRTKINHGFFPGQYVAIDNTGLNRNLEGVFQVYSISTTNPKEFKYRVVTTASAVGLIPGASITPNSAAIVLAEIDSVESASPYVFNVSIRSVWGICGIWADGRKATGFKSMVIAQYTGVSLQKDDRAFIRYDEFSNTWNQAPLTDAFATTPYHIKGDAFFKDDWRTFHVRASDDSFIQNVSIFAVGFADHFLLESGGDMSITNSNSNFGNTSMHSKGFKGFAFNQDKGGYITDIIPPKILDESAQPIKTSYYPIDVQLSKPSTNSNRLYLTGDKANNFLSRPAASINGYRIGARTYINDDKCEKLYVNTTADQTSGETGSTEKSAVVYPQGFKIWSAALDTLSPANLGIGDFNEDGTPNTAADTLLFNLRQDAANLIDANKIFIQAEAFGYILEKYPYLQTISYVNPNITFESGRYRDARNLILANRQEIVDTAYSQMLVAFPTFVPPSADKCKRDIGLIVDAIAADLYDGGNANTIAATKAYFDVNGNPIVDGVVGEVTQSVFAFNKAKDLSILAITNQLSVKDLTITADPITGSNINPASCANVQSSISTLFLILTTALTTSSILTLPPIDEGPWSTVSESSKCRRDIGYIVEAVTADLRLGGNENTINAAEAYFTGTGQQTLSGTIASNGVITGLTSTANLLVGMAVTKTSGAGSFGVNPTILTINSATQITVTQTSGTVTAGAISFVANQLDYIEKERVETLDAYDYVRNIAISAMRNHNTYVNGSATGNSSIITVPSTNGLVIGMSVRSVTTIPTNTGSLNTLTTNYNDELEEILNGRVVPKATNYTTSIPSNAYIMKIGNGSNGLNSNQIRLGTQGSKFDSGVVVNASGSLGTNTPVKFFFQLETGVWANAIKPSIDNQVIQDYNYTATSGECSSVVENINTFFTTFNTVINNGIGSVARKVSTLSTGTFAQRATIFTLTDTSAGASPTNPHHLETGTPVRLVPRPKAGVTVDKRFIRLPRGFDTNTVYYIIAPGRKTDPYDYSNTTRFDGTTAGSFQSVMLASSAENAATGIYIYSSETEGIDENVVIDVYQYVLDVKYDLNQYTTSRGDGTTLVSEEPHVFDLPNSSWNLNDNQKYQAIFFKPVGSGTLPTGISSAREYYARYVNKPNLPVNRQFEVYDTLTQAIQGATPLTFPVFSGSFYTFSNKKRSPLRFAPEAGAALSYDETRLYVNNKSIFAIGDYVKVADEFFFVTGISVTGSDHLVVTRSVLGTFPVSHSTGAPVNKWNYNNTATTTTLTETVDLVETILDFTSVSGFAVGDFVRLTNSVDASNEVIKITKIEGTQVIVSRAQLGTVVQLQLGTVTATRISLTAASPAVTTTLSEAYPKLLTAAESGNYAGGTWYIAADSTRPNTILERMRKEDFATKDKTPDTWFERISDDRTKEDRVYRLRYVIPNYLKSVRDPLNGFIIKSRNDQTRRLLPQKILVKPTASGSNVAELSIPNQGAAVTGKSPNREYLGYTTAEHGPNFITLYDPYNPQTLSEIDETPKFRKRVTTDSKVTFYVESARRVLSNGTEYLQLTVFNIGIEEQGYKEKLFTTVKINPPQGGTGQFVSNIANLASTDTSNIITWSGACKGKARVHAYFSYGNQNYMILKDITGVSTLEYNPNVATVFTQGTVSSTLLSPPNEGRSDIDNYLYAVEGSNAYTMTPGDTFQAENGNYTIASVEDTEDFEDTFYIFDINEVRRRIAGQQDGVYYLTCLRGNISPFPTGAGVGLNFRDFKFSQPVSKLYPEFYKNDPEWYKQLNSAAVDAPETTSAADNYVHGLVTVNDSKASVTREGILDFVKDRGSKRYTFTGTTAIKALPGGASAGSEARRIPVCGNSDYPTEKRIYVELRRPSIARSGNHTFEYLGFGPGNYSTGFPSRQEVLLSDIQDFYAQAKRENGGIVFYTGLNSNGDLYIGNRKINAITGEETFLESAQLVESSDDDDTIGSIRTTFDGPVTFNDVVSFLAPLEKGPLQFTAPIYMDVGTVVPSTGLDAKPAIQIKSNISTNDDPTLRINPTTTRPTGDIIITDNRLQVAVLDFNTRGLQDYSIRTAINQVTPDQLNTFGQLGGGTNSQVINLGSKYPLKTGDILLKGEQVGLSGSIAWVYGNNFATVANAYKYRLEGFGAGNNKVRILWAAIPSTSSNYTNSQVGIKSSNYQIKITGTIQNSANAGLTSRILGAWSIISSTFSENNNFVDILLNDSIDVGSYDFSAATEPTVVISISNVAWKEVGVIGAESIRTQTDDIGDYRVGINTVARTAHTAYTNGFVESGATDPRANLDIVGTTFISGKTLAISPNNYIANATLGARTFNSQDNALLVGGDSLNAGTAAATLRLATTDDSTPDGSGYQTGGRIGINTVLADLDRNLVIKGNARITGDFKFENDIDINGGGTINTADVRTSITTGTFNLLSNSGFTGTLNLGNRADTVNSFARASNLNIGNTITDSVTLNIATSTSNLTSNLGTSATNLTLNLGNSSVSATSSKISLGGAYNANESNSFLEVKTKSAKFFGDIQIGANKSATDTLVLGTSAGLVNFFSTSGSASTILFGLNASTLTIGGQGGTTTIRNSLTVDASILTKGNITLDGGTASFSFNGTRAQLGSTIASHTGFPNNAPLDKNIDLVTVVSGFNNAIDTAGTGSWGGSFFQNAIATYLSNSDAPLVALTGNLYYLPLASVPTYAEGDDILIDSAVASGVHPEIVKVASGGLIRTNAAPYYIIVERQPYGTFLPQKTNHQDDTITRKVNVALDATWILADTDGAGTTDLFALAEFGGTLATGDYIFVDRSTTGTTGEAVKIASSTGATAQKLIVTNGAGATKFEVNSVTGATIVSDVISLGGITVYGPLNFISSCVSTGDARKFKLSNATTETFSVDMCNGETTITQGTLTTDVNAIDATATWNSSSVTFTGIKLNVTNTASNNASKLIDLQIGGTTRFNVDASSGDTYLLGDLTVAGNDIKSSTNTALTLSGANVTVAGDLTVTGNDIKSSTGATVLTLSANDATFADNLTVTGDLTVNGGDFVVNSGGTERFNVNNNGAIDLGGITQYFTPTGGRKWVFISTSSNTQNSISDEERLVSNTNYFVNPIGSGSILILLLPTTANNGDVIRIVDVAGQLKYNTQLLLRAPAGVRVQGDSTGSALGLTTGTYDGGELIVNTPNAAFGLVYVGSSDGNSVSIPSTYRGWWLMEI